MTPIHSALSHYWHLRDQGLGPDAARAHVRQRFGVELQADPLASTAKVIDASAKPRFTVGQRIDGGPISGGPVQILDVERDFDGRFTYTLRWPDEKIAEATEGWDIEAWAESTAWADPVHVVSEPDNPVYLGFGRDFCKTGS